MGAGRPSWGPCDITPTQAHCELSTARTWREAIYSFDFFIILALLVPNWLLLILKVFILPKAAAR